MSKQQKQTREQLVCCRLGETIRNIQCRRINKSGEKSAVLTTLTLRKDERSEPDIVAMIAKPRKD